MLDPTLPGLLIIFNWRNDSEMSGRKLCKDKTPLECGNACYLCSLLFAVGRKVWGELERHCATNTARFIIHRVVPTFCVQLGDFTKGDGDRQIIHIPTKFPWCLSDAWDNYK
jgi:cyclophilin family peptidyl-prolyl cis-trans isomerase